MQIFAFVRPFSTVDRSWKRMNRTGGEIDGVQFNIGPDLRYEAVEVPESAVVALSMNPSVELEIITGSVHFQPIPHSAAAVVAPDSRSPEDILADLMADDPTIVSQTHQPESEPQYPHRNYSAPKHRQQRRGAR